MFSNDRSVDQKLNIALKISNLEEKLAPSNMELTGGVDGLSLSEEKDKELPSLGLFIEI